jgi:TM2 domain-containing membrane protein YozV
MNVSTRSYPVTYLCGWFLGILGVHRFYLGRWQTGLAMLLTLGGLGIWWIVDMFLISCGALTDVDGKLLRRPSERSVGEKSQMITFLLCAFLGIFGAHRFYLGRNLSAVLMLLTFGGLGIWLMVDSIFVGMAMLADKDGNLTSIENPSKT